MTKQLDDLLHGHLLFVSGMSHVLWIWWEPQMHTNHQQQSEDESQIESEAKYLLQSQIATSEPPWPCHPAALDLNIKLQLVALPS